VRLKTSGAVIFDNNRKVPGAIRGGALSNTRHVNNASSLQHSKRRNLYMKKKKKNIYIYSTKKLGIILYVGIIPCV